MSLEERHEAGETIRHIVFPLLYSAHRHPEDGEQLRARIDEALRELRKMAYELKRRDYPKTAGFLERNAKFSVNFAMLPWRE